MKMKSFVLVAALALSAASAYAENKSYDITLTGPSPENAYTAGFVGLHSVAGAFEDTFTFTPDVSGFFKGSLVTTSSGKTSNINFTSATINGVSYAFSPTGDNEFGFSDLTFGTGPFILKLFGVAGPDLKPGTKINASYSGTLNISAVPEPATYGMMLGGLGLFGFIARRRKQSGSRDIASNDSAMAAC
jgi:hypothetical protein